MDELKLQSSLSPEEIDKNFEDMDFFSDLMNGLEEALTYSKGNITKETYIRKRSLPTVNVLEIRESLQMTQKSFANVLGVSRRTVESWETGRTTPTPTAKKLMHLIRQDPTLIEKL